MEHSHEDPAGAGSEADVTPMPAQGEAPPEGAGGSKAPAEALGGWRGQPLALKILLIASLAAITIGVVRCSVRVTAPDETAQEPGVAVARSSLAQAGRSGAEGDGVW